MYLNCHSVFSLRYGTMKVPELLQLAKDCGLDQLVLSDINNTSAGLNFVREAQLQNIKPILGIDFRNGVKQCFVGIAKNNAGYLALNNYLSEYLQAEKKFPQRPAPIQNTWIIYPFSTYRHRFVELRPNEFIGIALRELQQLPFSPWRSHQDRFVLKQTVTLRNKRDFNIHRLLRAIANNTLLSKLPPTELANSEDKMYSVEFLNEQLEDFPQIVENTKMILENSGISFHYKGKGKSSSINKNKASFMATKAEDQHLLLQLCKENLDYRYPEKAMQQKVMPRLEKELNLIQSQGFEAYFLINWDMLRYAREQGFFYVGRGSGANSLVAYLLRITDVDPIQLDLYFERFLNPFRENPPDFDIDFSWKDRDKITDYLFDKYGKQKQIALVATYTSFTYRSLMRELGKVFGLPKSEMDQLANEPKESSEPDDYTRLIYRYAKYMDGIPSHLSIHAGGVLISEEPIHYYSATFMPPKGYPTVQFDMVHAEDAGLYKYDVLSQRGLGKIKDALEAVMQNHPNAAIDLHQTQNLLQDPKINELLSRGDAMGCFYIESPAMRMLLQKLKVKDYLGLVAASSIIRPGVAKSGMMRQYILRSQSESTEWHKEVPAQLLDLMQETYGVMVYQEDVIKVAHHFAGLDLGEADVLRRGMSGKFRSRAEFAKVQEKFFSNCLQKGYGKELTQEIWRQIESFAGYAFSKGHSASYAIESYQSLYLKAYYPMEFILGVLNNGGGFYRTEFYVHQARMLGAKVEAHCVNSSEYLCSLHQQNCIYLGFVLVKDLESNSVKRILQERQSGGAFKSLEDVLQRCKLGMEQMTLLIRIKALRFTGKSKQVLLWELHHFYAPKAKVAAPAKLFAWEAESKELPELDHFPYDDAYDEMELLGFPLCSPFDLLKKMPQDIVFANELSVHIDKEVRALGYLVTVKNTRTGPGQLMQFGTFIDQEGNWIDTVHFPPVVQAFPFRGKACYLIIGKVVEEFGYASIEVKRMERLDYVSREQMN